MLSSSNLWHLMEKKQAQNPNLFRKYEADHDIKKLKLQKITAQDLPRKILQFKELCNYQTDSTTKNWLENQYRVFIWFVLLFAEVIAIHPKNFQRGQWNLIAASFKKPSSDCRYFYLCTLKNKSESWKTDEDKIIIELMQNTKLHKKWTDLGLELFRKSEELYFRKPKTIRERWSSHLNPDVNKSMWKNEEDLFLFKKVEEFGKKWSKISSLLGSRSQHSVKNRYHHILNSKCKNLGQTLRSLSKKRQIQLIREYKSELQREVKTQVKHEQRQEFEQQKDVEQLPREEQKKNLVVKEEIQEPYIIGYVFHPIILTSLPSL